MKDFFIELIALLSLFSYSCSSSTNSSPIKPLTKDSLSAKQDTFLTVKLFESPDYIQPGFIIDSLEFEDKKTKSFLSAYFPRLSQYEYPLPYRWIKEMVNDNRKWFRQDIKESDDSLLDKGVDTKLLYKDEKILSIVMSEWSSPYHGNPGWGHRSLNYDLIKKKKIGLNDYFILKTTGDTLFLNRFLDQCVGGNRIIDIRRYDNLSESFTFGIDSVNIYFFFGRYEVFGFGDFISIVPQKYIIDHINPGYR